MNHVSLVTGGAVDELSLKIIWNKNGCIAKRAGMMFWIIGTLYGKRFAAGRALNGLPVHVIGYKGLASAMRADLLFMEKRNP